jgi:hypothetical protein
MERKDSNREVSFDSTWALICGPSSRVPHTSRTCDVWVLLTVTEASIELDGVGSSWQKPHSFAKDANERATRPIRAQSVRIPATQFMAVSQVSR